ncbi:hypothetical protein HYV73_02735 [Candidatus Uhrbacteria bacterium]|nr:hypothetical protein [Candidatus Uhrbacteria bacterium]
MTHILKATSKGQITIPSKWRKTFKTNKYLAKEKGGLLEITQLQEDDLETGSWETIFDAKRDNKGKGVPIEKFIAALKRTL